MSNPFVPKLIDYVRRVAAMDHIRIVGVCFGHQIVALALGGDCVPGNNGWEIGVYGNELTEEGRYWWTGEVKGEGGEERIVSRNPSEAEVSLSSKWYAGLSASLTAASRSRPEPHTGIHAARSHRKVSCSLHGQAASGIDERPTHRKDPYHPGSSRIHPGHRVKDGQGETTDGDFR